MHVDQPGLKLLVDDELVLEKLEAVRNLLELFVHAVQRQQNNLNDLLLDHLKVDFLDEQQILQLPQRNLVLLALHARSDPLVPHQIVRVAISGQRLVYVRQVELELFRVDLGKALLVQIRLDRADRRH